MATGPSECVCETHARPRARWARCGAARPTTSPPSTPWRPSDSLPTQRHRARDQMTAAEPAEPAELPAWLHELSVAEHAISDPGFYLQLLCGSLVCCAAFCMGCMLVYLQNILKPLVFSIFLMYLLSPVVHMLTTPIRIKRLPLLQRIKQRVRRRAREEDGDVEEELCALVQPGEAAHAVAAERASAHLVQVACPDWLAILVVLAVLFTLLWTLCNAFIAGCSSLQAKFPVYRVELLRLLELFTRWLERIEPRAKDVLLAGVEKWLRELPLPGLMEDTLSAFFGGMETLFLVSAHVHGRPKANDTIGYRASTLAPARPSPHRRCCSSRFTCCRGVQSMGCSEPTSLCKQR